MREPDLAEALIAATVDAVDVPVTVKMRLGWADTSRNAPEIAAMAARGEGGYRLLSRDWSAYDKYFGGALEMADIPRRELDRWQARAYLSFYIRNRRLFSLARFLSSRRASVAHYLRRLLRRRA